MFTLSVDVSACRWSIPDVFSKCHDSPVKRLLAFLQNGYMCCSTIKEFRFYSMPMSTPFTKAA
jgi:hypothetical protein